MRTRTVICLNGPRGCGKDTVAAILSRLHPEGVANVKASAEVKKATHREFALPEEPFNRYEAVKDLPHRDFGGRSPRDAYILVGTARRDREGPSCWGDAWGRTVQRVGTAIVAQSDTRFQDELDAAVRLVGADNVLLLQIHRPGCTWAGDIGSYLRHGWMQLLHNDGTQEDLAVRVSEILDGVL